MEYEDKMIVCGDCGKEFAHTAEDQKRYAERGFSADPKRCRECRQVRKDKAGDRRPPQDRGNRSYGPPRSQGQGGYSGNRRPSGPPRGDRGGGGRGGGGGGYGGRGPRQSFDAICAACGTPTTVPFEPRQGREVYCRECFQHLRQEER